MPDAERSEKPRLLHILRLACLTSTCCFFPQLPGQDFVDRREEIVNYVDGARHALLQVLVLLEWVWRHKDAICTATEGKVFIGMQVHHVSAGCKAGGEKA